MKRHKPYLTYKPSGVEWLVEVVPSCWIVAPLKRYSNYISRGISPEYIDGEEMGIPIINQACIYWEGLHIENVKFHDPSKVNARRGKLYPRDLLINSTGTGTLGRIAIFNLDKEYLADSHVTIVRTKSELSEKFLYYLLQSNIYQDYIYSVLSPGATKQIELSRWGLSNTPILIPPLFTQQLISAFLDCETTHIDTLITKKRALINLLQKKRTAIITETITKGLNSKVTIKDSGIPWIGNIPEHWEVRRFKFMLKYLEQGWSPACESRLADEEEWGVLKVGCVNGGYFNELEHKALPGNLEPKLQYEIKIGDILISRANTKELLGSVAKVHSIQRKLLLCDKLYRLKTVDDVDPDFFVILLQSICARYQFERDSSGASDSMQNISQASMVNFTLPLPPLQEQKLIVDKLNKNFRQLDELKEKLLNQIQELQKYRQALRGCFKSLN